MWPLIFCLIVTVSSKAHVYVDDKNNLHLVNIKYDGKWKRDLTISPEADKETKSGFRLNAEPHQYLVYLEYEHKSGKLKFSKHDKYGISRIVHFTLPMTKFEELVNKGLLKYRGKSIHPETMQHYMISAHGGVQADKNSKDMNNAADYTHNSIIYYFSKYNKEVDVVAGEKYSEEFDKGNMAYLQQKAKMKGDIIKKGGKLYDQRLYFGKEFKPTCGIWQYSFNPDLDKKEWETLLIGEFPKEGHVELFDIIREIEDIEDLGAGHIYISACRNCQMEGVESIVEIVDFEDLYEDRKDAAATEKWRKDAIKACQEVYEEDKREIWRKYFESFPDKSVKPMIENVKSNGWKLLAAIDKKHGTKESTDREKVVKMINKYEKFDIAKYKDLSQEVWKQIKTTPKLSEYRYYNCAALSPVEQPIFDKLEKKGMDEPTVEEEMKDFKMLMQKYNVKQKNSDSDNAHKDALEASKKILEENKKFLEDSMKLLEGGKAKSGYMNEYHGIKSVNDESANIDEMIYEQEIQDIIRYLVSHKHRK